MNLIKNKLHSKRGASLMIALVFLIFAVFIGGSVLAAASANGYRIEHLSDQQDYLNQRSAALLLAEEMDIDLFSNISLDANFIITTRDPVKMHISGREYPDTSRSQTVDYSLVFEAKANGDMDTMTRVMFETAVLRYLEENKNTLMDMDFDQSKITLKGFSYNGTPITSISQFWTANDESCSGTIQIYGTRNGETENFTEYTARYTCAGGDQAYDFVVDFGDYSQITITMNGFSGMRPLMSSPELEDYGGGAWVGEYKLCNVVTQEIQRTAISWNRPAIAKGGT